MGAAAGDDAEGAEAVCGERGVGVAAPAELEDEESASLSVDLVILGEVPSFAFRLPLGPARLALMIPDPSRGSLEVRDVGLTRTSFCEIASMPPGHLMPLAYA